MTAGSPEFSYPNPNEQPAPQEEWSFPRTPEALHEEVTRLEILRDQARAELLAAGKDPDEDPDYRFLKGKLWVFQEHLTAHTADSLLAEIEGEIGQ